MDNTEDDIVAQKSELHKQRMRAYQYRKYHENKELSQKVSLTKYYKRKGLFDIDEKGKYGDCVHFVCKTKRLLELFKTKNAEMLKLYLKDYLANLELETD